jgi:hypothetical protein
MSKRSKKFYYPELFPNGYPIGDPNFMDQYINVTPKPDDYEVGTLSRDIVTDGVLRSNDKENPINDSILKAYREKQSKKKFTKQTTFSKQKPSYGKLKKRSVEEEEEDETKKAKTDKKKDQVKKITVPKKMEREGKKQVRLIIDEPNEEVEIESSVKKSIIFIPPPVEKLEGELDTTSTNKKFFKIKPLILNTLPASEPTQGKEFPQLKIPLVRQVHPAGKNAKYRPVLQPGAVGIRSFRPGEVSTAIIRTIKREKLSASKRKTGKNDFYSNEQIQRFVHQLGISETERSKQVTAILKMLDEYEKSES